EKQIVISPAHSWDLAYQLVVLLRVLERNHLAHCDISGANVMVRTGDGSAAWTVNLIDFDELYWPRAPQPPELPGGTPGYCRGSRGQWEESGDRFAAAVLLAEMLGWRDAQVRGRRSGESYFAPPECEAAASERYSLLEAFLGGLHPALEQLFAQAWS